MKLIDLHKMVLEVGKPAPGQTIGDYLPSAWRCSCGWTSYICYSENDKWQARLMHLVENMTVDAS